MRDWFISMGFGLQFVRACVEVMHRMRIICCFWQHSWSGVKILWCCAIQWVVSLCVRLLVCQHTLAGFGVSSWYGVQQGIDKGHTSTTNACISVSWTLCLDYAPIQDDLSRKISSASCCRFRSWFAHQVWPLHQACWRSLHFGDGPHVQPFFEEANFESNQCR